MTPSGSSHTPSCGSKILLINIHYSLDFIAQTSAESSTTRYASPFAYAICMQAKVFAVQGHSYCITGVATNNYSMNFNYLAARGGELAPDSLPLDPPLPYIHFSCTNTNGFIQGNMLNTPQAVPLICKASVVQTVLYIHAIRSLSVVSPTLLLRLAD